MALIPPEPINLEYKINGMDCPSCAKTITEALQMMEGISDIHVSVSRERLSLKLQPGTTTVNDIQNSMQKIGFPLSVLGDVVKGSTEEKKPDQSTIWWGNIKIRQLMISAIAITMAYAIAALYPQSEIWAFSVATLIAVGPIAQKALCSAQLGVFFTIQMLMTLATIGALVIGEQEEACIVVLLFSLGEVLEGLAADKARSGIRALMKLLPRDALLEKPDGGLVKIEASGLQVDQVIVARPGDRIAADGEILSGVSSVDESPVTGESVPVSKEPGLRVRAGTINHDATLRIRVDCLPEDNTIARIIAMVEEAQDLKAPTERYIDSFSRVYMPIILVMAVVVAVLPPLMGWGDWGTWSYRALALLLIGCPCALVISVPAAVASSLSASARAGILIKGGGVLETLSHTDCVVFDKTGTLTIGKPRVTDIIPAGSDELALMALSAAIEKESSHPLAIAIVKYAEQMGINPVSADNVRVVPGKGMVGEVQGKNVFIGAPHYAAEYAEVSPELTSRIQGLETEGKTVSVVVVNRNISGLIAMRDEPRMESRHAIDGLKKMSILPLMMTGDNSRTGIAIGQQLGIDVRAEMLPEDKAEAVAEIATQKTVIMVGDGINDAPALAVAHVGIAIGSGTDVAIEASDAALIRDRVDDLPRMIGLSRATMRNIRQNVGIALSLKACFFITTLMGATGLWLAILADTGATILVTGNAMRLLGYFRQDASS